SDPAKGFQVQTPDGTVTDLGTEFGVYVKNEAAGVRLEEVGEEEQQPGGGPQQDGKQAPVTEVHVFKGRVDVAPGDQLAQAPTSSIPHPPSTILQAGQAATISDNKVQPLPAADPFKFALDKLQGNLRTVLLSEDFEALTPGSVSVGRGESPGGWTEIGTMRKGQGGFVIDPVERQEGYARAGYGRPAPVDHAGKTPFGRRAALVAFTCEPPNAPVWLGHEIDGRALSGRSQILVEFDILRDSESFHPVLAFGPTLESRVEIPFTKNANAAAAATSWVFGQWYRQRLLLDVIDGKLRKARVQRMKWEGKEGWKPDVAYSVPTAQAEWPATPRYIAFGSPPDNKTFQWLDNIRLEVITEK
ncbi:MAG: FecR family protein, partial [Planctomycetes bacterium]|nr:FecR family protein [Planctomycetota bacterium]